MGEEYITPYSYHTFIFPFIYDGSRSAFANGLNGGFERDGFISEEDPSNDAYAVYRYFNKAMRNAIYTRDFSSSEVVWNYRYSGINPVRKIKKSDDGTSDKAAETQDSAKTCGEARIRIFKEGQLDVNLDLNAVRVKLFKFGVGMLVFETENYETADENDIILINEYGRRIYVPFKIPGKPCPQCADLISVSVQGKVLTEGRVSEAYKGRTDEIELSPVIKYFLPEDSDLDVENSKKTGERNCYEPIGDDRMFVACIYNNKEFVDIMSNWDAEAGEYSYLADATKCKPDDCNNAAARLYKMVFVDGDGLTCYSRRMMRDLLEDHVYDRWLELGTLNSVTEYSMVCVTSAIEFLSSAFLSEYVEMVMVVLAQRASLLTIQRDISDAAKGRGKKLARIYDTFIDLQCSLLLPEVTEQQQGIELYGMMREHLFVEEQTVLVEEQIESAHENNSAKSNKGREMILFVLALFGLVDIVRGINDLFNWFFAIPKIFAEAGGALIQWVVTNGVSIVGLTVLIVILVRIWKKFVK